MFKSRKITIVGAGLSGMIAAINLAREGHRVCILEKHGKIGGSLPHHPSNHGTPLAMDWIWDYIGIDLSDYFLPSIQLDFFIGEEKFFRAENENYICERGCRKTAIDKYLYNLCIKTGVTFEFNCKVKNFFDLPDPTIIATGLHKAPQEILHRPMLRLPVFASRRKLGPGEQNGRLFSWVDDYTRCYGYSATANDLMYTNMFSYDDLNTLDLKKYQNHIRNSTGLDLRKWAYFEAYVPTGRIDAPQLFEGSKILTGTLSGAMCPFAYFGIHGALVSGKISAIAVSDPEKAIREFSKMTSNFKASYLTYMAFKKIPGLTKHIQSFLFKHPLLYSLVPNIVFGIPGLTDYHFETPKYLGKISKTENRNLSLEAYQ